MKTKPGPRPSFYALMIGLIGAAVGSAQPGPRPNAGPSPVYPETVAELVDSVERDWSGSVERNQQGLVVKLRLSPPWCNDRNIALAAQLNELHDLTLQGGKPTSEGLRVLRGNTNLCALHFACFPHLPHGMLSEVATWPQVTRVSFWGTNATSAEYASLADMTNLTDLRITETRSFRDAELARLTALPALKNLIVRNEFLTPSSAALLSRFRALTNAELRGWPEQKSWSTNWHSLPKPVPRRPERNAGPAP